MYAVQHNSMAGSTCSWSADLLDIEEINQDNYYQKIAEADAPIVLVDFYTQWYDASMESIMFIALCVSCHDFTVVGHTGVQFVADSSHRWLLLMQVWSMQADVSAAGCNERRAGRKGMPNRNTCMHEDAAYHGSV